MQTSCRNISLRQVADDDKPFLFRLFSDPSRCHLWLRGRSVYDEAGFERAWATWTTTTIAAKFIVESGGRAVGLVYDYDRTLEDGWTRATTLLLEDNVGHGGGVIATTLFMGWLFQTLPIRKVYHEVYAYNANVVRIWRKLGLAEEGVLKQDRYWAGAYWDLHIFALYRDAWLDIRQRLLRVPREEDPPAFLGARKEVKPADRVISSDEV